MIKFYKNNNTKQPIVDVCNLLKDSVDFTEIIPNSTEADQTKHLPVVTNDGNIVNVVLGEVTHPMMEKHFIEIIALETNKKIHVANLSYDNEASTKFVLIDGETPTAAYAYCNIHGLWKTEL